MFVCFHQFLQIQNVLQNVGEEGQDELVKLRDDLVELIQVSEGAKRQPPLIDKLNLSYILILYNN